MNITSNIHYIYIVALEAYNNKISKAEAVRKLVKDINMRRGSATMIINHIFPKLVRGEEFKRTLSIGHFDFILNKLYEDFGIDQLRTSLTAINSHISYISKTGDSKKGLKVIVSKYLDIISKQDTSIENEIQQEEILTVIKNTKTREQIAAELRNIQDSDPEVIIINHKAYKRDNIIIAKIKFLRGEACQICGNFIPKWNGKKYIEAAHITPKRLMGKETPDNIMLLCPNHHKEFDFGQPKVLARNPDNYIFELNGNIHTIKLTTE